MKKAYRDATVERIEVDGAANDKAIVKRTKQRKTSGNSIKNVRNYDSGVE